MAVQFNQDAQMAAADITLLTNTETNGPSTNNVISPFDKEKVAVTGMVWVLTGTGVTGVQVRVRRNINGENVVLGSTVLTLGAAASTQIAIPFGYTDAVPDNRPCSYTVTVQQVAATGNGAIKANSYIDATGLSG
jgi:hypothetical protein